jgi:hypothetical protein
MRTPNACMRCSKKHATATTVLDHQAQHPAKLARAWHSHMAHAAWHSHMAHDTCRKRVTHAHARCKHARCTHARCKHARCKHARCTHARSEMRTHTIYAGCTRVRGHAPHDAAHDMCATHPLALHVARCTLHAARCTLHYTQHAAHSCTPHATRCTLHTLRRRRRR